MATLTEKLVQGHGTPYGSSSTSGQSGAKPTADELVVAKHQGARVTQVAAALKAFSRPNLVGLLVKDCHITGRDSHASVPQ